MMNLRRRTFLGSAIGLAASVALPRVAFGQARAPFPLYDTHAHFYTNDTARYPFNPGAPETVRQRIIDRAMARPMTPEAIFKLWDENGIAMGCGVQYNSTYQTDNRYLLDVRRAHPDRITAIIILNPVDAGTPAALEKMAREDKIAGVRFTGNPNAAGDYQFFSAAAAPSWAMANKLGLVIVLMPVFPQGSMAPAMAQVALHAARYPNVRIVLDHIGFPDPKALPATFGLTAEHAALSAQPNVFYKYTTLLIERLHADKVSPAAFLAHMVKTFGAGQMVWGTDVGNTSGDVRDFVTWALESASGLPEDQQRALFHDTARRIFVPGGLTG